LKHSIEHPIKVAALTDHSFTPSSRFRIRQLAPKLKENRIEVTDLPRIHSSEIAGIYHPDQKIRDLGSKFRLAAIFELQNITETLVRTIESRRFDATIVSRELIVGYPSFEKLLRSPIYYDIDDAIFLRKKSLNVGINHVIRSSNAIFAGNSYLADYCSQFSKNIEIVPTSVDTDRFIPYEKKERSEEFYLGWSGTSSSFKYLETIESALLKFFQSSRSTYIIISADRYPYELKKIGDYIIFKKWTEENEVESIQKVDLGLMPIDDTDWSRGKCSYKMLLYLACKVPAIASDFGMNSDILRLGKVGIGCSTLDSWLDALVFSYENRDFLETIFPDCRRVVVQNFSLHAIANKIGKIISRDFS